LFVAKLLKKEKQKLAAAMVERDYREGAKIVIEGDVGDEFFIIKSVPALVYKLLI
jgi:hypothetical protein